MIESELVCIQVLRLPPLLPPAKVLLTRAAPPRKIFPAAGRELCLLIARYFSYGAIDICKPQGVQANPYIQGCSSIARSRNIYYSLKPSAVLPTNFGSKVFLR